MVRILEFDRVEDLLAYQNAQGENWMSVDEFNAYLKSKGHREIKTSVGRKSYCERNNIEMKKNGRAYFFKVIKSS